MIKANEIRMGNYFHYYNSPDNEGYIIGITVSDHSNVSKIGITAKGGGYTVTDLQGLMPIPLTEDRLIKFGFKCNPDGLATTYWFPKIILDKENEKIMYEDIELKHVHQLQNLYFALTGTELEIK